MLKYILPLAIALTGCGKMTDEVCTTDVCFDIFGHKEDSSNLEQRIAALEQEGVTTLNILSLLLSTQMDNEEYMAELNANIAALYLDVALLYTQLAAITPVVINNTYITYTTDIQVIDPCPTVASSGPKEYIIRIDDKYIAYFESGHSASSDRFITVLSSGATYRTTDSRECLFTIE